MSFQQISRINSSLRSTVLYMVGAVALIEKLCRNKQVYPFQFDTVMAVGEPLRLRSIIMGNCIDDDDDKDDDDQSFDDEKNDFIDAVGDIKGKLDANKLKYCNLKSNPDSDGETVFQRMFEKIQNGKNYMRRKRLVALIDRRAHAQKFDISKDNVNDEVFLYEAPKPFGDIPKCPLPEWSSNASRQCLLPDMEFENKYSCTVLSKYSSINVENAIYGEVITFSFYAKKENVVKLYCYYNGQCMRLMPDDVKVIFPCLFNMDYGDNKQWIKSKEVDECIEKMNDGLSDIEFAAFSQSYK